MKRYDMQYRPDWAYNQASMMPSDIGEYVKYEESNARIAELTTKVADLKSKLDFANAMNADQGKEVAGLNGEVDSLRLGLASAIDVAESWIHDQLDGTSSLTGALKELDIARNALKDVHHD